MVDPDLRQDDDRQFDAWGYNGDMEIGKWITFADVLVALGIGVASIALITYPCLTPFVSLSPTPIIFGFFSPFLFEKQLT